MEAVTLQAEVRETRGKGPARQLRMRGLIPAVFYGPGAEPVTLQLDPAPLRAAITGEYGRNQVLELAFGDQKSLAVVKDIAVHPVSRDVLHVDFYAAAKDRPLRAEVPFLTTGRALGVQKGGAMHKRFRSLPIKACPQDVPSKIVLDVAKLDLGANVTVADLKVPEGVEIALPPTRRVLMIDAKERAKKDDKAEGEAEKA